MKRTLLPLLPLLIAACTTSRLTYEPNGTPIARSKNTVTVAANDNYNKVNNSKRFFLGEHFRKEWATPVEVEILNLDSLPKKLTPTRMGGGNQTKSLRLKSEDGHEYVLRSINKDPSKALPQEFVGTFADDIVQDQISSSNPYAPLVVAELAEAARIFHTTPKIVFVDSAKQLGEFNNVFGNSLCLFEERPIGNQETNPAFGYTKNIINSEKLFEKIFQDKDHAVNEESFLKARLFDMWIGDWDRHEDQWVWASFQSGGKTTYKPIPRDRDQAFVKLDGLIPQIAARKWAVRRTQNFDYTIRDINGLNLSGNSIDRLFTTQLTFDQWKEITNELQQELTDEKIEHAFSKLPTAIYKISGEELIQKLKKRRNDLLVYAFEYYQFLSQVVNVMGSDRREYFEVTRLNNDTTLVSVFSLNKKNEITDTVYNRIFLKKETQEIRLYGLGGADKFIVKGNVKKGIIIRVIGGDEKDYIHDESHVKGWNERTIVYDQEAIVDAAYNEAKYHISSDTLKNDFNRKSFRYNWLAPKIAPGFNPDDGVYFGGGFTFKRYQFGKQPFGSVQSFWGNYAVATGAYNFQYEGLFKETFGKWDLKIVTKMNAPNAIYNFYGMGNETKVIFNDWSYYRVRMNQITANPSLQRSFGKYHSFNIGLKFNTTMVEQTRDRFVSVAQSQLGSTLFDRKYFGSINVGYQFTTLDNVLYPHKGIKVNVNVEQTNNLKESDINFTRFATEVAYFKTIGRATFAFRAGGSTISNTDFEFYQAATVGGQDNLRAYRRTRFSGKSALFQNTELRFKLNGLNGYVLRGNYGVLTFFDTGRVWIPNEESNKWHSGYGAGLWFLPYDKVSFTITYGRSSESNIVNIKTGFTF